jgi:dTDP-4-amino-4,6-dideoxygalactose transaminase
MLKPFDKPVFVAKPILPDLTNLGSDIQAICESGWLTNHGAYHNKLETKLAEVLGVSNVSVVNNGTIGLLIALRALEVREGEVITTPFTFPATPHAISWNGLTPVFCDITPDTYCIDPKKIESQITSKTKAIMGVHVFGYPCEVEAIQAIADAYGLKVIYDAAHAFKTTINENPISQYGDISVFSFHATKLYHSIEGGCLSYSDGDLERTIYLLRNFGIKDEETVVDVGINGKLNEIQAAVGLLLLDKVEEERNLRAKVYQKYSNSLSKLSGVVLPDMGGDFSNSYQYYPVRIIEGEAGVSRDYVYEKLKSYNVMARKYFYPLCSEYSPYKNLPSSAISNLPVANMIKNEILCLPFYGELNSEKAEMIGEIINKIVERA